MRMGSTTIIFSEPGESEKKGKVRVSASKNYAEGFSILNIRPNRLADLLIISQNKG